MEEIRLKNFRCFREQQTARMAPLTLLVGENSTGKTSFMALIRALWDAVYAEAVPDFKETPYDLGSFDEIVHNRSRRDADGESIEVGLTIRRVQAHDDDGECWEDRRYRVDVTFARKGAFPVPAKWRLSRGDVWIEECVESDSRSLHYRTANGEWSENRPADDRFVTGARGRILGSAVLGLTLDPFHDLESSSPGYKPWSGHSDITGTDREQLYSLVYGFRGFELPQSDERPFAGAPVRSKPRRTYDPARPTRDPEGENIPMYLSTAFFEDKESWEALKDDLESFGCEAGLFDEIAVRSLGKRGGEPFQLQVRKYGTRAKGPMRNLIDVGYGVSQVLPILTELFRNSRTCMFLLQQPEVHLHPSAQAALGSLFCNIAAPYRQLVVETHSDHLLDRVRMDVRDGRSRLKPAEVSILFFERGDLDVRIHSLRLDGEGNVLGAPPSYRRFFMEESRRSLRL